MIKKFSRKEILRKFQNSNIQVTFLRRDQVLWKMKDSTQKKFWEKLFGSEPFELKDLKVTLSEAPKIHLTFKINKEAEIDYIEVILKEKHRSWFESTFGGPMLMKFTPTDTITLHVELRDIWDES